MIEEQQARAARRTGATRAERAGGPARTITALVLAFAATAGAATGQTGQTLDGEWLPEYANAEFNAKAFVLRSERSVETSARWWKTMSQTC